MRISQNILDKITIIVFLGCIGLPPILMILNLNTGAIKTENRITGITPGFEFHYANDKGLAGNLKDLYIATARYINKFDQYFSSSFSFRSELLHLHNYIKGSVMGVDPLPLKVVEGSNGWLFPGDSHSNVIKETKGIVNFSRAELHKLETVITERNRWLVTKGVVSYLAVAPDKLSVYGDQLQIKPSPKKTKAMQLDSLSTALKSNFINLKERLNPAQILYMKTDSHWNDYGAFLAYQSLMDMVKRDFPDVPVAQLNDFSIDTLTVYQQDLTKLLSMERRDSKIVLKRKHPGRSKYVAEKSVPIPLRYDLNPALYEQRYKSDINALKVVVFRDSFTSNLEQFIVESFGEVLFIWSHEFNQKIIETEKPDIVIEIIIEREVDLLLRDKW